MNYNVPLMRKVLEHIEMEFKLHEGILADPSDDTTFVYGDWDQALWATGLVSTLKASPLENFVPVTCATTACFAGHAAMMSGGQMVVHTTAAKVALDTDTSVITNWAVDEDGVLHDIETWAMELLGLNKGEADRLFYMSADPAQIRAQLETWVGEKI